MALRLTLSLLMAISLWGGQSLITTGADGTFSPANAAPFAAMTQLRYELRITNWQPCTNNFTSVTRFGASNRFEFRYGVCANNDMYWCDGASAFCTALNFATLGYTDITLKMQWTQGGQMVMQAWPTATGGTPTTNQRAEGYGAPQNISGSSLFPQSGIGTMRIAWARVYNTTVPTTTPIPKNNVTGTPILDWEFEGNGTDSAGNANITLSGATYATTPVYAPVAIPALTSAPAWADGWGVVRSGESFALNANNSLSFPDNATLSCRWSQTAGPTKLAGLPSENCSPSVTGTVFGEYSVALTVIDSTGVLSTTVPYSFGSVPTDSTGRVLHSDPNVAKVFGPMLTPYANAWPSMSKWQREWADFYGSLLTTGGANWLATWDTPFAGTVSVTNGSATVTGTGTNFQTALCAGGTTPVTNREFILYYPVPGGSGEIGKRNYAISTCNSATTLTLASAFTTLSGTTGSLQYSYADCQGCWVGGSGNNNYYDNVLAHYRMYLMSGRTAYRDYARTLAQRFWMSPWIDRGRMSYVGDFGSRRQNPRNTGLIGVMWWAYETASAEWPYIRLMFTSGNYRNTGTTVDDYREQGYTLVFTGIAAFLDPDSTNRAARTAQLVSEQTALWAANRQSGGYWIQPTYGYSEVGGGALTVTNGSTVVTAANGSYFDNFPANQQWMRVNGDSVSYWTTTGSGGTVNLETPYLGTSGAKPTWRINTFTGTGVVPYLYGILATGFAMAAQGTTGATQTAYQGYLQDIVSWLQANARRSATKAVYYGLLYNECVADPNATRNCVFNPAPISDLATAASQERYLNGEIIGALGYAYQSSPSAPLATWADSIVGPTFSILGGPDTDQYYPLEYEQTSTIDKPKTNGFVFGVGASTAWAAARTGSAGSPVTRTFQIGVATAGATSIQVRFTLADGTTVTSAECVGSACEIPADVRLGGAQMQIIRDGTPGPYQPVQL